MSILRFSHPRDLEVRCNLKSLLLEVTALVGGGGMLAQLVLVREFLVSFYGNELTLGVVLSNWLILEAFGALVAGRKTFSFSVTTLYVLFLFIFAGVSPLVFFGSRVLTHQLFDLLPGEVRGITPLFLSSLCLLFPVSFIHGALFSLACRLLGEHSGDSTLIGKVYVFETLGTLLGGVLFTFVLSLHFLPSDIVLVVSFLHLGVGNLIAFLEPSALWGIRQGAKVALVGLVILLFLFAPLSRLLQESSLKRQWLGYDLVHYQNTPYGNLLVLHRQGEYTILYDGQPFITIPFPDTATLQEFVHLSLSASSSPRRVLLLGGGLGGMLWEVLKHPVERVTCVELDPYLPEVLRRFSTPLAERELQDPRVQVVCLDGRRYLAQTQEEFDFIALGFLTPETLQVNRLFTKEFFALLRLRLSPQGIVAIPFPGSSVYVGEELADLNRNLYYTLRECFSSVAVIPGDFHLFLASGGDLVLSPSLWYECLKERGLSGGIWSPSYLNYRLQPYRQRWLEGILKEKVVSPNSDLNPRGFFYALLYWGRMFSPPVATALHFLDHPCFFLPFLLALGAIFVGIIRARKRSRAVSFAIWTSGVTGMAFDLLVLFLLQCFFGFVYQATGSIVAAFMGGTLWGGNWGVRTLEKKRAFPVFLLLEEFILLLLGVLYLAGFLGLLAQHLLRDLPLVALLAALAFFGGMTSGAQFPLASAILLEEEPHPGKVGGNLYTLELLGGWLGGLAISLVLFPLWGLRGTILFLVLLKGGSAASLWALRSTQSPKGA